MHFPVPVCACLMQLAIDSFMQFYDLSLTSPLLSPHQQFTLGPPIPASPSITTGKAPISAPKCTASLKPKFPSLAVRKHK